MYEVLFVDYLGLYFLLGFFWRMEFFVDILVVISIFLVDDLRNFFVRWFLVFWVVVIFLWFVVLFIVMDIKFGFWIEICFFFCEK